MRWRGNLVQRIHTLYGPRAPLVAALTLARKEGLDPELRDAFARAGLAHLLAISGFHVGVVAVLLLVLLRKLGLGRRRAALLAALATWGYVALLGFPDAASRAAVILTAVAASRLRGRPSARWGPLGAALLVLVATDPHRILSPGFQLSFAGAAGLAAWAPGLSERLGRAAPRMPSSIRSGVAAGCAATVATLPVVAWHFERVSVVGVPATLVASPLVVLALPGALMSLIADMVHHGAGSFLAGGVSLVLALLTATARVFSAPSWASIWLPRSWVPVAAGGAAFVAWLASRPGVGRRARRTVGVAGGLAAVLLWPVLLSLQARGTLEVVIIDVGQGDAIALRSPRGRWMLVDAGPDPPGAAGASPVVRELRRRGVRRLGLLVLTHPHLDHIGGAPAVLESFPVDGVLDPARATGSDAYVTVLQTAEAHGVPWRGARVGESFDFDGAEVTVLSAGSPADIGTGEEPGANEISVVLQVRYGALDVLLTGDAPAAVEDQVVGRVSASLEILKVGHHGSDTSSDSLLLAHAHPELALISVGRGNHYGHPSSTVVSRLLRVGAEVHRTDREGTLDVLGRRDGTFTVSAAGPGRR